MKTENDTTKHEDSPKQEDGAGCASRLARCSSFCYEVRERGISAFRIAWMIAEDWKRRKMEGPIPIMKYGAGLWVIKELESRGIAVEGVQVKAGQVHVRIITELAYHVADVSNDTEERKQEAGEGCLGATCSQLREPLEAPRDGTMILAAVGWPWLVPAVWNTYDQDWVVCHMQAQTMANGLDDRWLEMEREKAPSLTGWLPVPPLPVGYVFRPANA